MSAGGHAGLERTVIELVGNELRVPKERLGPSTHLQNDLGADSLDALNIALQLERAFSIKIPDDALPRFVTIRDIVAGLGELLGQESTVKDAHSHASEFLSRWSLKLADLAPLVRPLRDTETLLLVGSIPDGLANPLSDIDLMLVGDGELDAGLVVSESEFDESVGRLPAGQELNLEYWKGADLERLADKLQVVLDVIADPSRLTKLNRLTEAELRLAHRVRTGVVLANPGLAQEYRRRLRADDLPDYLILHWITAHYILREDAIAQAHEGDGLSMVWMLRFALDFLAGAMLASVGETNPYSKWRPRLLERNAQTLGRAQVDRLLGLMFAASSGDSRHQVSEGIDFADQALAEILERRPHLLPAMMELDGRVSFAKHLDDSGPVPAS